MTDPIGDHLTLFERFVLFVLATRAGDLAGDGRRWSICDPTPVALAVGASDRRVLDAFDRLLEIGALEPATIGGVRHFVLVGGA